MFKIEISKRTKKSISQQQNLKHITFNNYYIK